MQQNLDMDEERARKDALAFLLRHKTGVLATVTEEGEPHASMVYYTADQDFNVYFLTLVSTRKFRALQMQPRVAFTVSSLEVPQTLQIEGNAMDISLDVEASVKKDELLTMLNANPWFPAPITRLDPAMEVVVWIRPLWVRWADYAFAEKGTDHVFKTISLT